MRFSKRYSRIHALIVLSSTFTVFAVALIMANLSGSQLAKTSGDNLPVTGNLDLIKDQNWQLAGVTNTGNSLSVVNTNLEIVNQDGSPGQVNPPVNLYGIHLQTTRNYSITATLSGIKNEADIALYGTPPLIEDEYRAEAGTLAIVIKDSTLSIDIKNQISGRRSKHVQFAITPATNHILTINNTGGILDFALDNKLLGRLVPGQGIFSSGQVWFGLNSPTPGSSFEVDGLTASPLVGGKVAITDTRNLATSQNTGGFAAIAQKKQSGFLMGAAVALGPMVADPAYNQILGNYNSVTTENVGKFQFIHPLPGNQPGDYNFSDMDAVVAIAGKAGMKIHGHTLVFGEANPAWVQAIAKNQPSQLQQVMIDHIKTVVGHYKGQVQSWDVIDEPLADYDTTPGQFGLRQNIWYKAIGSSYIATALNAAHAADPNAGLWINDFGLETDDDRFNQMINLVKMLQAQNVPITGIGFEAHIDDGDTVAGDTHIDKPALAQRIKDVQALGLKARFSELDVSSESEYPVFSDVVSVCMSQPACTGVTTWGITDKYSSSGSLDSRGRYTYGIGLPWDVNEQPLSPVAGIEQPL